MSAGVSRKATNLLGAICRTNVQSHMVLDPYCMAKLAVVCQQLHRPLLSILLDYSLAER